MALIQMDFYSYYLGMDTAMTVLLPEKRGPKPVAEPDRKYPVLYLLHGHGEDNTAWIRKSNIELWIRDHNCIVVMPAAQRSFYTNYRRGHAYFDFLTKELPVVVGNFFPASNKREDTYIAGCSMGGYGAMKAAMSCPELYGHAASMSGASDPYSSVRRFEGIFTVKDVRENLDHIFGGEETCAGSEHDLKHLAELLQNKKDIPQPQLYLCCGTKDPLWPVYEDLKEYLTQKTSLDITYHEMEGMGHTWEAWDQEIRSILEFFGLTVSHKTGQ